MRTSNGNIKLKMTIPIDKPDLNGVIYTREAIEKAVKDIKDSPILYRDNDKCIDSVVIGHTVNSQYIETDESDMCKLEIEGCVYYCGAELIVNEMEGNVVKDFRFTSFGISR